jgi:hypothetical protein
LRLPIAAFPDFFVVFLWENGRMRRGKGKAICIGGKLGG